MQASRLALVALMGGLCLQPAMASVDPAESDAGSGGVPRVSLVLDALYARDSQK